MKIILIPLVLLLVSSCATKSERFKTPDHLSDLQDKDFERPKPYRFIPSKDYFSKAPGGEENDALRYESLQRVDVSDVEDKDIISQIAKLCVKIENDEFINEIRKSYNRYRNSPAFWNQVGICYLEQKNYNKALLFFNKSLDYKGDYAPAYNNLGVLYWRKKELEKAVVAFDKAKNYGAFSSTPKLNLGFLYLSYQLSEKAEAMFEGLYQIGPKDRDVLAGLMTSYLFNQKFDSAVKICNALGENRWEKPEVGINCAKAFWFSKDKKRAIAVLDEVDKDDLGNWKKYYNETKQILGVR